MRVDFTFLSGFSRYLNMVFDIDMPPNQEWHCRVVTGISFSSALCSTFLIVSMTFERFYSIILPHKAASFNTVKRAKITIICIIVIGIFFNFPHFFFTTFYGRNCIVYGHSYSGQIYLRTSLAVHTFFPFIALLIMNSVIIHTLRKRITINTKMSEEHQQDSKIKSSERQIFIMLLLVSFGFLLLNIPGIIFVYFTYYVGYSTARNYAAYYLIYNIAQKTYYTNFGINFFLYVISGQKFRSDLVTLFKCRKMHNSGRIHHSRKTLESTEGTEVSGVVRSVGQ